ncbi:MAG: hypothetical protein IPK64_21345 [bacterium]|nr:hypothetical protein [bacterium]
MAQQFHIAFSKDVMGVGVIAGGPYFCAAGNIQRALNECMKDKEESDIGPSIQATLAAAAANRIDSPEGLRSDKVYLFSGQIDATVNRSVMDDLNDYYRDSRIGVKDKNIVYIRGLPAAHSQVIDRSEQECDGVICNRCNESQLPFLNACRETFARLGRAEDADTAGRLLQHIYGQNGGSGSQHRLPGPKTKHPRKPLIFDQKEFAGGSPQSIGMMDEGYIYVPKTCEQGQRCRLHVAFHGCRQNKDFIKEDETTSYVLRAGYNEWAENNKIIILYPQAAKFGLPLEPDGRDAQHKNPGACWDWWGYTDPGTKAGDPSSALQATYHTKTGKQMAAVKAMVDRLTRTR